MANRTTKSLTVIALAVAILGSTIGVTAVSASAGVTAPSKASSELAATVRSANGASATTWLCKRYQELHVNSSHKLIVSVRNDWWGARGCMSIRNHLANYRVRTSYHRRGGVVSFPEIYTGCQYGHCTPYSHMPRRVTRLYRDRAAMTWYTSHNNAGGMHNTAFDIWFGRTRHTGGHSRGAELMIWLKAKHLGHPAGRRFRIGGRTWILSTWRAHLPGTRVYWNYVRFWAAHPTNSVKHLRLNPFVRIARRYGKIHRSWWLWTIDAGNEIWNGGRGLHTAWFWAKP